MVKERPSVLCENPPIIRSTPLTVHSDPITGAEIPEAKTTRLWVTRNTSPPISSSLAVVRSVTEAETALEPSPVTVWCISAIINCRSVEKKEVSIVPAINPSLVSIPNRSNRFVKLDHCF